LNYTLLCLSEITLPVKRGTFIEYRTGMLNISPIGRNCSQSERDEFEKYDAHAHVRRTLIEKLKTRFHDLELSYSIGG
jgi:phosphomannomutase